MLNSRQVETAIKMVFVFLAGWYAMAAIWGCTGVKEGWNRHWDDKPKTVIQFSGGKEVGRWTSLGKVQSEASSDGWYFIDSTSQKQVMVTGDIQITDN